MIRVLLASVALLAPGPGSLVVRDAGREVRVPLVATVWGSAMRPDLVAPAFGASVRESPAGRGRYILTVGTLRVEVVAGMPFAMVGAKVIPMTSAPFMAGGKLHVPLQLFSEILPRYDQSIVFRATSTELSLGKRPKPVAPATPTAVPVAPLAPSAHKWRIVVDAGHGGVDPGTSGHAVNGKSLQEKDITLAVAKLLSAALRARGVDVLMTRDSDIYVPLDERGRTANRAGGDLFISVHVNAASPTQAHASKIRGVETYFLSAAQTADAQRVADLENSAARFDSAAGPEPAGALGYILHDMARNQYLRESADLAMAVQGRLGPTQPGGDHGVKQARFRVLVTSLMPAVLVELGYLSNSTEASYLAASANQKRMASDITDAVMSYLGQYERRLGASGR